jgi:hypothetical protein
LLYSTLMILKYLPKITIFYVLFSFLIGLPSSSLVMALTVFLDVVDYIPVG